MANAKAHNRARSHSVDRLALEKYLARRGANKTGDTSENGGFSSAVCSDQGDYLTGVNGHGEIRNGEDRAVVHRYRIDLQLD
jgi:hypothetical protein